MPKVSFSHDIEEALAEQFDKLHTELRGKKYELLEASLRAFMALPEPLQNKIKSGNPQSRKLCLDLLRALQVPVKSEKRAQRAKSAKAQ